MRKRVKFKNLAFFVLGGIFIFSFIDQEIKMKKIEKEILMKKDELKDLKKQNKVLEEKMKTVNTDEYIETLARERLDMVKPGEEIIKDK
ncbi:MAG: FtsB family cell division protein [Clostridium sp.]|uniref:FtsB family cell division protein n=1 Tax=Clostridium sp. TaxID=1506 RepID=UPI003EE6356F